MNGTFGVMSKNSLLNPRPRRFFSYVFLLFWSMAHFDLIFVESMSFKSRNAQFQYYLLTSSFLHCIPLGFCQKSMGFTCVGLFLDSVNVPLIYVFITLPILQCLNYYSYIVNLKIRKNVFSKFLPLFQNYFSYFSGFFFFVFSYEF